MTKSKQPRAASPAKILTTHPTTRALKKRGWTKAALDESRLYESGAIAPSRTPPPEDFSLLKAYLLHKALLFDRLPASVSPGEAWTYIACVTEASLVDAGPSIRRSQSQRAKAPRGILCEDGVTLDQRIEQIATRSEYSDLTPKKLWPHLFAELDDLGLSPTEHPVDRSKIHIEYDGRTHPRKPDVEPRRKTIGFSRFRRLASNARKAVREPG